MQRGAINEEKAWCAICSRLRRPGMDQSSPTRDANALDLSRIARAPVQAGLRAHRSWSPTFPSADWQIVVQRAPLDRAVGRPAPIYRCGGSAGFAWRKSSATHRLPVSPVTRETRDGHLLGAMVAKICADRHASGAGLWRVPGMTDPAFALSASAHSFAEPQKH
jgi:hypothetical protein